VKVIRAKQLRREMTPAERALWARLRKNQLGGLHFRRQQVIDGFIANFYCHAAGVVVEVDGPVHEGQAEYDAERDRIFQARGLRVIRFTNDEVLTNMDRVFTAISWFCHEGGTTNTASS
jgi:very-short-patch-repair endonuclease